MTNLSSFGYNVTSEHGEDGIIEKIFETIGSTTKTCVELGALNGVHGSNVWRLIKEQGWGGVLIEADSTYFEKLQKEFEGNAKVECVKAFVSFEGDQSLDKIFSRTSLPHTFDLFSLDIDGNDYHLWDSLVAYKPRVMVVEFNPTIPNSVTFVQPRNMNVYQGSSLRALKDLATQKGYELIATTESNAFFVLRELYPLFNIDDNSIDVLHTDTTYQTQLYQLYDGTLRIAGYDKLFWHGIQIDEERLQVLPPHKRAYPARIASSSAVRTFKYWVRRSPLYPLVQKVRKHLSV